MVSVTEARSQLQDLKAELQSLKMDYPTLREVEMLLNRTLTILERSTGSKEIAHAINSIQRLITIIRMAQITIHTFQMATGPIGWALALSGIFMTGTMIVSTWAQEVEGR